MPIFSRDGSIEAPVDISGMSYPMRCKRCNGVHDSAKVTAIQRYSDCTFWKCPLCGVLGDDRPLSWGGTFERYVASDS